MKIRIRQSDKIFSQFIRTRAGWKCERCYKQYEPPTSGLHCSHFWGSAKESTRFEPDNCAALCYGCHMHFTANPIEHTEYFKIRLGEKRFKTLTLQANATRKKRDDKIDAMYAQKLLNELL